MSTKRATRNLTITSLPPTELEEQLEAKAMELVEEILGRKMTVKEKRKVEGFSFFKMPCGSCPSLVLTGHLYRCLYCEALLCAECAEKHFGETRSDYHFRRMAETLASILMP